MWSQMNQEPESARDLCGLLPLRGWRNAKANRYSPEVRERAVRMVAEHRDEYPSEWAAFTSIAGKFGMTPETLRIWVRRAQINEGCGQGRPLTSARS
jgi:transposase-like protein